MGSHRYVIGVVAAIASVGLLTTSSGAASSSMTVTDPSGMSATTQLTFSRSHGDPVTISWPNSGDDPYSYHLHVNDYTGRGVFEAEPGSIGCDATLCSWSGELADANSGDTAHVDLYRLVDGGTGVDYQPDRWRAALLPPDTARPTITVRIPRKKVPVGRPIRLKVAFSDNQTEFGWDNDDCAPGGDCYHPDWYPLMSLNKGRTWTWLADSLYSRRPRSVHVWVKWPDEALNMSATFKSPRLSWVKGR